MSSSKDGAMPSKVWKEPEAEEAETIALTGPSEVVLSKARFELYQKIFKRSGTIGPRSSDSMREMRSPKRF